MGRASKEHPEIGSGIYPSDGEINLALLKFRFDAVAGIANSANFVDPHHIGFQVDDPAEAWERIEANGGTFHFDLGNDEAKINFRCRLKDPNGVIFDIS